MKSPFPGMDPFIEARGKWRDFHQKLVSEIERTLAVSVPGRYAVRLDERTYVDWIDPDDESRVINLVQPDIRVDWSERRPPGGSPQESGVAVAESRPITMHSSWPVTEREVFANIVDLSQGEQLVTCIEMLSPTNKRSGSDGRRAYSAKRERFLRGAANFVEIDLLRQGARFPMREPWPDCPYYVLVSRKDSVPQCDVWPAESLAPLPKVAIPLLPADSDVQLSLQPLVDEVFVRSRYYWDLRYEQSQGVPLSPREQELLADHLARQVKP